MVDLLGRAGLLREALEVGSAVPVEPNSVVWGSLLNVRRIHGNLTMAEQGGPQGTPAASVKSWLQVGSLVHEFWGDRRWPPSPSSTIRGEERYRGARKSTVEGIRIPAYDDPNEQCWFPGAAARWGGRRSFLKAERLHPPP
ncbi:unnamed protein product [Spirodela intermedia]|uniref:Uncharacterized protein n=1 Tax=Spirodela intermedia TaxID=51605 RepID=A0A7I8IES1_SPIIN|nr:unnamed protein product [Spirodela intermedia]CAA6656276.1 unnamed protein product [Spirodela intermedia]